MQSNFRKYFKKFDLERRIWHEYQNVLMQYLGKASSMSIWRKQNKPMPSISKANHLYKAIIYIWRCQISLQCVELNQENILSFGCSNSMCTKILYINYYLPPLVFGIKNNSGKNIFRNKVFQDLRMKVLHHASCACSVYPMDSIHQKS